MAELHVVGRIRGGVGFTGGRGFWCRYSIHKGEGWDSVQENLEGQSHIDYPEGDEVVWSFPLDLHFNLHNLTGWPRLFIKVFTRDAYGTDSLVGYCVYHIPTKPGFHEVEVATWKPIGTLSQQWSSFFIGNTPQLSNEEFVFGDSSRYELNTESSGTVLLDINVVTRNFKQHGIEVGN
ncbi:hypothetical protein PCE1_003740 [Barthelona sp. PCE]